MLPYIAAKNLLPTLRPHAITLYVLLHAIRKTYILRRISPTTRVLLLHLNDARTLLRFRVVRFPALGPGSFLHFILIHHVF